MIIGLNYMVIGKSPQCVDTNLIDNYLNASFTRYLLSAPGLCSNDLQYYPVKGNKATKNFYSLDVLGHVNANELFHRRLIEAGLLNAWSLENNNVGYTNVSMPTLSNQFETRFGSFGSQFTRIYYVISIDGKQAINGYLTSPSNQAIMGELRKLGSDMSIVYEPNSVAKSLLSSLFVLKYPLNPNDRLIMQANLNVAIQQSGMLNNQVFNFNSSVLIYYAEFYNTQTYNNKASRVYYAV